MEEKLSYEEALSQLQTIVKKLENKEVKIDELAGTVARANQLVEYCQTKLQQTEVEIQKNCKEGLIQVPSCDFHNCLVCSCENKLGRMQKRL